MFGQTHPDSLPAEEEIETVFRYRENLPAQDGIAFPASVLLYEAPVEPLAE